RAVDVLLDTSRLGDLRGPLADLRHQPNRVDVLQRTHVRERARTRAADADHGHARPLRIGHGGHGVGDAGPSGDQRYSGLARDARVGVSRERRRLLVARVVDGDTLVDTAVVDRLNVAAA